MRTVAAGESMLDPDAASRLMQRMRDQTARSDPLTGLTDQERRTQAAAYAARIFADHGPPHPPQSAH